jgi:tetratricopeptide (TPR) repeat protein
MYSFAFLLFEALLSKTMKTSLVFFLLTLAFLSGIRAQPPADVRELLRQAELYHQTSSWKEAADLYSRVITVSPGLEQAYLGRATAREQLKDFQGALTDYSLFLELHPDHYDALLARANARFKVGQFEEAKQDYLRLLNLPPGETNTVMFQKSASVSGTMQITTAQSGLNPVLLNSVGMCEFRLNRYAQALQWLDSAIALQPRESDYYVNRGMIKEKIPGEIAEVDYNRALQLNPQNATALHNLGVLKSASGAGGEAYFEKAIESDSSMLSPYLERAYQRMQSGSYQGALEDYNRAIAIEKNDPEIWLNRGFVKEKLADLQGAYTDYTMAIHIDREYGKAWLNRGNVLARQGKHNDAIEDYSTAIAFDPEYGPAYYNRAVARQTLKMRTEACEDLKKAARLGVKIDPRFRASACE